ncbi:MAG: FKBP-type peptidyl-prolyl cis-trans isomerase [Chitinophagaceae bacterium]|nr:FKBP-type peptidyl-prolyl cis-trans isomerase [Chitinophagaceae bacterium]
MKKLVAFSIACIAVAQSGFAQQEGFVVQPVTTGKTVNGWTEVSNGLQFRIWKDAPGSTPTVGDFITIHTRARVGDSVLFSSRAANNNEPFELQVRPSQQPRYDLMDGFQLLSEGDSATFRMPLDTVLKMGAPELPWMKKGGSMWFDQDVVVVKQKKQADAFKEKAEKGKAQMATDEKLIKDYLAKNNVKAIKHPSGLYYRITKTGLGDTARSGQKVTVNYTGKTLDGKTFDSNVDSAFHHVEPFSFSLGQGQVIPGWDVGVGLMKKGTKATLYIPSPMAYGERSPSPAIPANAVLVFDVEVKDLQKGDAPAMQHGPGDGHNH